MYLKSFILSVTLVFAVKNLNFFVSFINCLEPNAKSTLEDYFRLNHQTCNHNRHLNLDTREVQFSYYNLQTGLRVKHKTGNAVDQIYPNLDPKKRLIFFVPGLKSLEDGPTSIWMRDAFKNVTDINYMQVDYSPYTAKSDVNVHIFINAITNAYYIGNEIAKFLSALNDRGFKNSIHVIGHSLGGQIAGYVGDAYKRKTNRKIRRITGIDPSGPCFTSAHVEDQLRSSLADYVEVYHCNVNQLGTGNYLADVDYLVNGGSEQPECIDDSVPQSCSHIYCTKQWCQSISDPNYYTLEKKYEGGKHKHDRKVGYHTAGNLRGVVKVSTKTA